MPIATIPLTALRVADGKLAVTLDDIGHDPRSIVVEVVDMEKLMEGLDCQVLRTFGGSRQEVRTHVLVRRAAREMLRLDDPDATRAALLSVLWLALNHPMAADQFRIALSEKLRTAGRAHLTAAVDTRLTWSFTIAERWIDLHPLMDGVPSGIALSISPDRSDRTKALN